MKNFFKKLWQGLKNFFGQDDGLTPSPVPPIVNPEPSVPTEPTTPGGRFGALTNLSIGDHGIDISHHNSSVNLTKVKEKQKFVIMKATEGGSFLSKVYKERIVEATKLGIPCGAYHYYRTNVDWKVQADHFLKYFQGNIPPVLDIEAIDNKDFSSKHTQDCLKILKYLEEKTGMTPIVYSGYYFLRDVVKPSFEWSRYPLWLSWYTADFNRVKCPWPWTKINIWQYSETAQIEGVGKCDANIFNGL